MARISTSFTPYQHGFLFRNSFDAVDILRELGSYVEIIEGFDLGTWGLCGGMVWAALDRYYGHSVEGIPPIHDPPHYGEELFSELVWRQVDLMSGQLDLISGLGFVAQLLYLQALPDYQGQVGTIPWSPTSVGMITEKLHWPLLKAAIDEGFPATIGIIRVRGVKSPFGNHVVLGTGYELNGNSLEIEIYDPNYPGEVPNLQMTLNNEDHRINASHSRSSRLVRGFIHLKYDKLRVLHGPPRIPVRDDDLSWFWTLWGDCQQ